MFRLGPKEILFFLTTAVSFFLYLVHEETKYYVNLGVEKYRNAVSYRQMCRPIQTSIKCIR